ncbi:MAG: hypothetical protein ABRQ24_10995 [Syntrophomonadaceae bacterium]
MERNHVNPGGSNDRNRQWIIRPIGGQYQVGFWNRPGKAFNPVCCCDYYDQASLICQTLRGNIQAGDGLWGR